MQRLTFFQIHDDAPRIEVGNPERAWMDATTSRFAYRCLPLMIANSMGWQLLSPAEISAEWSGKEGLNEITVDTQDNFDVTRFASSHFGHGILTFQIGYLLRTDPGIGLLVRGVPNLPKDGICPLEGVVETDWLSFSFTMNWKFTRPGKVTFKKDEPFCFLMPLNVRAIEDFRPEIRPLRSDAELSAAYAEHRRLRTDFNAALSAGAPEATAQAWQKWYMRGTHPDGTEGSANHAVKLRVSSPVRKLDSDAE